MTTPAPTNPEAAVDWPEAIARAIARNLAVANGGTAEDAPTLSYDEDTGGWHFAINTPGGRMRVHVSEDAE